MGLDALISAPFEGKALELAGTYKGKLLILLGGGRTVWEDFQEFTRGNWHSDWDIGAINDIGMFYPGPLEHWYSHHADQFYGWNIVRKYHEKNKRDFYKGPKYLHGFKDMSGVVHWPIPTMGSSGLGACYVGLCLGYDRIVLCGVPLDNSGHFFDPPPQKTNFVNEAREDVWLKARDRVFDGKVCSMSGRSREWLGGP